MAADHSGPPDLLRAARAAMGGALVYDADIAGERLEALHANRRAASVRPRRSARDFVDQTAARAAGVALSANAIGDVIRTGVIAALRRRDTAEDMLCEPRTDIFAPAVAAMASTALRAEFCSLIASAMDVKRARLLLPAYVDLLRQLSRDEVSFLRALPPRGRFTPVADLVRQSKSGQIESCARHIVSAKLAGVCETPENLAQYVDNLMRLGLVARPPGLQADDAPYGAISRRPFVRKLVAARPQTGGFSFDRGVIGFTDLGAMFLAACLD
jgi:hypothetical protein